MSNNIGETLSNMRKTAGLTQREVATLCSRGKGERWIISRRDISKYERGDVIPPANKYLFILKKLSDYLQRKE